jgi:hypothetical protein
LRQSQTSQIGWKVTKNDFTVEKADTTPSYPKWDAMIRSLNSFGQNFTDSVMFIEYPNLLSGYNIPCQIEDTKEDVRAAKENVASNSNEYEKKPVETHIGKNDAIDDKLSFSKSDLFKIDADLNKLLEDLASLKPSGFELCCKNKCQKNMYHRTQVKNNCIESNHARLNRHHHHYYELY